jgi:hypothetical protein
VTYLAKRLGWRSLDRIRLTNLALPGRRVDLKTPFDDMVDFLISLRFPTNRVYLILFSF